MCEWSGSCACDSHVTAALLTACVTCHCHTLCRTPHTQWYWPRSTATPPGRPNSLIVGRRSVMFDSLEHTTGNHPLAPTAPWAAAIAVPPPPLPSPLRGIVPCSSIQPFTGVLPTPPSLTGSKVKEWNMAVAELKQYLENVRRSAGPAAANFPITVTTELPRGPSAPVKVGGARPVVGRASIVVGGVITVVGGPAL